MSVDSEDISVERILRLLKGRDSEDSNRIVSMLSAGRTPDLVNTLDNIFTDRGKPMDLRLDAFRILLDSRRIKAIEILAKFKDENPSDPILSELDRQGSILKEAKAFSTLEHYLDSLIDGKPTEAYTLLGNNLSRRTSPYELEGWVSPYYRRFVIENIENFQDKCLISARIFLEWAGSGELGFRKDIFTIETSEKKFKIADRQKGVYIAFD
jgi:hypothetical protein